MTNKITVTGQAGPCPLRLSPLNPPLLLCCLVVDLSSIFLAQIDKGED